MLRRTAARTAALLSALILLASAALFSSIAAETTIRYTAGTFRETILCRMAEECAALETHLASGSPQDVRVSAELLRGYASLLSGLDDSGAADAAVFCRALIAAAEQAIAVGAPSLYELPFWRSCTAQYSDALAVLALAADPANPDPQAVQTAAVQSLHLLAHAFAPDPLRDFSHDAAPSYTFDGTPAITPAQARQRLSGLLGTAARLLRREDTDTAQNRYFFSCENGYAELSVCGGYLLRYALHPRTAPSDAAIVSRMLSDPDLEALANTFLSKNGISPDTAQSVRTEDLHGIRIFSYGFSESRTVTVGIRQNDGAVMSYDSTSFYRRIP